MEENNNDRRFTVTAHEISLRTTAFCVTLLTALLTSVDNETYTFFITLDCWILKILNAIVCLYLQGSLILFVIYHIKKVQTEFPIFLPFDLLLMSLLCSSATVAALDSWMWEDIYTLGYPILLTYLGVFLFICFMYVATLSHTKKV